MKWKNYPDEKPREIPGRYLTCTLNGAVSIKWWTNPVRTICRDGKTFNSEYHAPKDARPAYGDKEEYLGWGFYNTAASGKTKTVVCWMEIPEPPEYIGSPKGNATSAYVAEIERLRKKVEELQQAVSGRV